MDYHYNYRYSNQNHNVQQKPKSRFGIGLLVGVLIATAIFMLFTVFAVFFYVRGFGGITKEMDCQEKLNTIRTYLDMYYLGEIDEEFMEDALAEGLLNGIEDQYAQYYTKEEFENLMADVSGSYGGIGISIIMNDEGSIEVYKVFGGTPADEAGIRVKDLIVEAPEREILKMSTAL